MFKLKEFYQYKRELKRRNKIFLFKAKRFPSLPVTQKFFRSNTSNIGQGIIYIKASQNNTIVTLTNLRGKVLIVKSCGCLGFVGKKKRSTKFAIESTLFFVVQRVKEFRWKKVAVYMNGFAKGRFYVLNCLKKSNLKFGLVRDVTPLAHNGCRAKKLRRG